MIYFDTFTKMPKNVGDLGKFIFAKGFKKFPKVQKIAQSGHTACEGQLPNLFDKWTDTSQPALLLAVMFKR